MTRVLEILPETKPYRGNDGHTKTHAEFLADHIAARNASVPPGQEVDPQMYEPGIDCQGEMVYHGERVANEEGVVIPHWQGDALHHEIVCTECLEVWAVETEYAKVRKRGVAGIEVEEEKVVIPW